MTTVYERLYQEADSERDRCWKALVGIAQYDPRWLWQHTNDAPSRQQLIERAFDAIIDIAFGGDYEKATHTVHPRIGGCNPVITPGATHPHNDVEAAPSDRVGTGSYDHRA